MNALGTRQVVSTSQHHRRPYRVCGYNVRKVAPVPSLSCDCGQRDSASRHSLSAGHHMRHSRHSAAGGEAYNQRARDHSVSSNAIRAWSSLPQRMSGTLWSQPDAGKRSTCYDPTVYPLSLGNTEWPSLSDKDCTACASGQGREPFDKFDKSGDVCPHQRQSGTRCAASPSYKLHKLVAYNQFTPCVASGQRVT